MHNPKLADKQNVSELNRKIIDKLHVLRYFIEENVRDIIESNEDGNDRDELIQENYETWFENEQLLQELWNFPKDDNHIKFWTFPGCACPKMDNEDAYPTGYYVKVQNCPVHGWK